ncbi:MAG: ABC transporter ATP-binding protein [Spirochaetes bacterium]|nr:ABC transporter ATP-binding protein [Spirochaetota bacterium]
MLKVNNIDKNFGGIRAIKSLSFNVEKNIITSVIGPNGAGKTTVFNLLTGVFSIDSGSIMFFDKDIGTQKTHKIAQMGITRTFQNLQIFSNMTVMENVITGFHLVSNQNFLQSLLRLNTRDEKKLKDKALEYLDILNLTKYANSSAKSLPFGLQRQIEIVRAIASNPKLLLLDEPAAGLNPYETTELADNIVKILKLGITILLIEHDMNFVMSLSDKIVVLNFGEKIAEGTPSEIQNNQKVISAYLGE